MNYLTKTTCLILVSGIFLPNVVLAQKPTPPLVVVQAANSAAPAPSPAVPAPDSSSMRTVVKSLQEVKAANDETLKRQEAALQQLEEMQKAAEQLKIFAHRTGG
jgi:hypothetical protein